MFDSLFDFLRYGPVFETFFDFFKTAMVVYLYILIVLALGCAIGWFGGKSHDKVISGGLVTMLVPVSIAILLFSASMATILLRELIVNVHIPYWKTTFLFGIPLFTSFISLVIITIITMILRATMEFTK